MACHRSSHHLHSHHQPCCCCCGCCPPSCCQSAPHPAIPSTTTATGNDALLQAIAAHLLQSPLAAPQPAHHIFNQQYPKPQLHHLHPLQRQKLHQHHQPQPQAQSLVDSLLSRIAALEGALNHLSSHPPPPAETPEPPGRKPQYSPPVPPTAPRLSIRDLAARTIQARFRQYLVRRSQALRHLKFLASVRSHVAAVKSSVSDEARPSPEALSQKVTDLLLQLDSIQSTDPMIREGKKSINRELVRLLEFADGVSAKRHQLLLESMEFAHKGIDPVPLTEKSSLGVEELARVSTVFGEDNEESDPGSLLLPAPSSRSAKRVSFAENGKASRVSTSAGVPFTEEELMGRDAVGRVGNGHRRVIREVDEGVWGFSEVSLHAADAKWEGGGSGSRHTSDEEKSPRRRQKAGSIGPVANGPPSGHKGSRLPGLAAPLPVQMEPRRGDLTKKKNAAVIPSGATHV